MITMLYGSFPAVYTLITPSFSASREELSNIVFSGTRYQQKATACFSVTFLLTLSFIQDGFNSYLFTSITSCLNAVRKKQISII
jgi:hypothetical protein